MKFRGLLVAVALLAVLGGGVWWSNKKQASAGDSKPADSSAPKMLSIPEDQIREIRVKKTGADGVVLKKGDDGKWQIVEPKPMRADQDAVNSMASALASLNADKLVEEKAADLGPYGLTAPAMDVTVVRKDGKADNLLIGDEVPTGAGSYAKVAGDARVFTIASAAKGNFEKTANDLRDKRLLTFDSEKLTRVNVQAQGQDVEFGKNAQNDWAILKPRPLRADGSQVEELIRKLKDAKMPDASGAPEDARKDAASFASAAKVAVVTVSDTGGNQQLEIRKDKNKDYWAKSSVVDGVYKVSSDLGGGLDKKLDDFRNKKLFDFGWSDPSKVDIRSANGATVSYAKNGEKWMAGAKQMDAASVQALIDKLRELSASKFADAAQPGAAVFEAGVASNDGKRVEKVTIAKAGDKYYAKRDGEPGIYELDAKSVEELQKAAGEVKEYQAPKKK